MNTYYISLIVLCATIYIIWQDPNVPEYINLRIKLLHINFIRWRMAKNMKRQLDKEAKKMQKEMAEWLKEKNGKDQM
jgi:hypothetical protein